MTRRPVRSLDRAFIADVRLALKCGASVRFTHRTCHPEVIYPTGTRVTIDGRAYQAFLADTAGCYRFESGSVEADNLVIEWRVIP